MIARPDQFVSRVLGEHVDFGIGTPERAGLTWPPRRWVRDQLAWYAGATYPLAARRQVTGWTWWPPDHHGAAGLQHPPLIDSTAARAGCGWVVKRVSFLSRTVDDQRRAGSVHHAVGLGCRGLQQPGAWWSRRWSCPACHATFRW